MAVEEAVDRETLIGKRVKRREDPRLLVGAARYVPDLELPNLCEAAFARSPVAHGTILSIDVSAAREAPGVLAVITPEDLADVQPISDLTDVEGALKTPRRPLPLDRVRYVGEPVAVVVATDRYLAEDAAELIVVDVDAIDAVTSVEAAMSGPDLFDHVPGNVYVRTEHATGGTDDAFRNAAHVVRRSMHINRQLASALETRGVIASYDAPTGELTCWMSNQAPFIARNLISRALGIPEGLIRIIVPDVGGAFGPKDFVFPEDLCVARASMLLGRPVRWTEDRNENLMAASHSKEQEIDAEMALDADGTILALRGRFASDTGAFSYSAPGGLIDSLFAAQSLPGPYDVPEYDYEALGVLTNKTPIAPYRGVGATSGQTVREFLIDEAAREMGIDRVAIRRRNLIGPEPHVSCTGQEFDGGSYEAALDQALDAIDWAGFADRRAAAREEGRYLGIGVSPFLEMAAMGTLSGRQTGIAMPSHDNATAVMDMSGFVTVAVPTSSQGQGHVTAFSQIAADVLGVDLEQVRVIWGDTERGPWGMGTFASRSAVFGGGSVLKAATALRERILRVASLLLEAPPQALELSGGFACIRGTADARIPLAEVAQSAHYDAAVREALGDSGLSVSVFYDSPPTTSNGCIAVEVEVDVELCHVRLTRIVAAEDCGVMLNPLIVDGQVKGGLVQGIGAALLEDFVYDENGQPLSTTYMDYLIPRASDLVHVDVDHLMTPSPNSLGGMKGMGEGSSIGAPAAVVNAVADALAPFGFRVRRLPLTMNAVWQGLEEAAAGA
jgi:carbon-monoxide dehydrogenase large subunit